MQIGINYFLNTRKATKKGQTVAILGRVRYSFRDTTGAKQSRVFRFPTGFVCQVGKLTGGRVKATQPDAALINSKLAAFEDMAKELFKEYLRKGHFPEPAEIKDRLTGKGGNTETRGAMQDFETFIAAKAELLGEKGVYNLRQTYNHLKEFSKRKQYPISYSSLNTHFVTLFTAYCLNAEDKERPADRREYYKVKLHSNTLRKYLKKIVEFLKYAKGNKWTAEENYLKFKIPAEQPTPIVALTEAELETVYSLDLSNETKLFQLCRDYYVLNCEVGARYGDYSSITADNFETTGRGVNLRIIQRKIVKQHGIARATVVIPVSIRALEIFKRYGFKMPPVPVGQVMNRNLKRIAKLACIDKELTTHSSRKTFATIMQRRGVPVPYIQKLTGHTTEGQFYKYIGIDKAENADLVRDVLPGNYEIDSRDFMKIAN